jgi:SulP family sulfate permease
MPADQTVVGTGRLWWREASGAVADLGVLVPITVALIVANGLSPTAVLLPAALLYLGVAPLYRLPVAVQPLKAFGAIAIAAGLGPDVIAAGALLMGATFLVLGRGDLLDRVARVFPVPVIRGIQLSVGLLFAKIAWGLATAPQPTFTHQTEPVVIQVATAVLFVVLLVLRRHAILVVVLGAIAVAVVVAGGPLTAGPSPLTFPTLSWSSFTTAAVVLVLPQLPLTFANSCLAPADAARTYFGAAGRTVTPARLARSLGAANLVAGAVSGMPVCHGAGGMSAHHAFGARTWRAPFLMGLTLLVLAIGAGAGLADVLPAFPLAVVAALLAVAGVMHVLLLRDLRGWRAWGVALGVGVVGAVWNLAAAVLLGLLVARVLRPTPPTSAAPPAPPTSSARASS